MKPIWVEEYINSVALSMILMKYENGSSFRQAFILLDNAFEQFMNEYVQLSNEKIHYRKFHVLLDVFSDQVGLGKKTKTRILEYHSIRNSMYHRNNYFVLSKERYDEYWNIVVESTKYNNGSLEEDILDIVKKITDKNSIDEYNKVTSRKKRERSLSRDYLTDIIIDSFDMRGNAYIGQFILGEYPGVNVPNYYEISFLIQASAEICGKKVYVLELIEANCENPFHSFIISNHIGGNWKCFIDSFWSKNGDGKDKYIENIRNLIQRYSDKVIYKVDYVRKDYLQKMFLDLSD